MIEKPPLGPKFGTFSAVVLIIVDQFLGIFGAFRYTHAITTYLKLYTHTHTLTHTHTHTTQRSANNEL